MRVKHLQKEAKDVEKKLGEVRKSSKSQVRASACRVSRAA